MQFIRIIDFPGFIGLIEKATERVDISLPGIDIETGEVLLEFKHQAQIRIVIDNSEDTIRHGFGDAEAIAKLKGAGIEIRECKGNMVSFILIDSLGYYIFPQSRIFSDNPIGPNAVQMDPLTVELLRQHFFFMNGFEPEIRKKMDDALAKSISHFEKTSEKILFDPENQTIRDFDHYKFEKIQEKLKLNPPLNPDIKRMLEVYTTRFQYVELVAKNIRISQHRASLPENSIPVEDPYLRKRLISSIRAFDNSSQSLEMLELEYIELQIQDLRKSFLVNVKCRNGKSLINKDNISEFKAKVDVLGNRFKTISEKLKLSLKAEIEKTKSSLKKEWISLFRKNPPEGLKDLKDLTEFETGLNQLVEIMILRISFPSVEKIVSEFSLSAYYSDLTWEDLSDEELLQELCEKRVIEAKDQQRLANFKRAVAEKK
jgi:hypothetical protein